MKFTAICAIAAMGLALASCGSSYNAEEVKAINSVDNGKYTTEQEDAGLKWYISFQEKQMDELKDAASDAEKNVLEEQAYSAANSIYYTVSREGDETETYKKYKDEITKNEQEIKKLQKEAFKAKIEAAKKLGFDKAAEQYEYRLKALD